MFVNVRSLPHGQAIESDLCIVGAGPGGLALAHELIDSGLRVAVLDSGGLIDEPETNSLSGLDTSSRFGNENRIENLRRLGGNAHAWCINTSRGRRCVRMVPYSPGDFSNRNGVAGWPIAYEDDYYPYIERAQDLLGLAPLRFEGPAWEKEHFRRLPLDNTGVETRVFQFPAGDAYVERMLSRLKAAQNVVLYSYANALELIPDVTDGRINLVRAASEPGRECVFSAKRFVLAGGGLAVPQLMLASTRRSPKGVGNLHDNVGRYFMDHPLIDGGDFIPASREVFDENCLYDIHTEGSTPLMGFLAPTEEALRSNPIANINMMMLPVEAGYRKHRAMTKRQSLGFYSSVRIRDALRNRQRPLVRDMLAVAIGADGVAKHVLEQKLHPKFNLSRGGWHELDSRSSRYDMFEVLHLAEQAPHRDNRITLGDERDRFGMRRTKIEWSWRDEDSMAVARSQEFMAKELKQAGVGEFRYLRDGDKPVILADSTGHFLGATRMHKDPRQGVVNTDCRVHGVANLYVVSSSTFPTGSYANPTLSIIAMGARVADHFKSLAKLEAPSNAEQA